MQRMFSPLQSLGFSVLTALAFLLTGCSGATRPLNGTGTETPSSNSNAGSAQFVYFGGVSNSISGIAISNNRVTVVPGSPFIAAPQNEQFSMAAAGGFIFTDCLCSPSSIVGWSVNAQTGALTQVSSASTPQTGLGLAVDPSNKFLYGLDVVYGFSINQQTGQLTPISGSPFSPDSPLLGAPGPQFSPDGTWMCGAAFDGPGTPGDISCAKRDPATGAILSGAGNQATGLAGLAEGGGPFVQGNYLLGNLLQYQDSSNPGYYATGIGVFQLSGGSVQQVSSYPGVNGQIVADPTGAQVAVLDNGGNITLFSFDATTATLTKKAGITMAQTPAVMSFTCDGNYLAVSHTIDNGVSVYSVASDGLQEIAGSPVTAGSGLFLGAVAACN